MARKGRECAGQGASSERTRPWQSARVPQPPSQKRAAGRGGAGPRASGAPTRPWSAMRGGNWATPAILVFRALGPASMDLRRQEDEDEVFEVPDQSLSAQRTVISGRWGRTEVGCALAAARPPRSPTRPRTRPPSGSACGMRLLRQIQSTRGRRSGASQAPATQVRCFALRPARSTSDDAAQRPLGDPGWKSQWRGCDAWWRPHGRWRRSWTGSTRCDPASAPPQRRARLLPHTARGAAHVTASTG